MILYTHYNSGESLHTSTPKNNRKTGSTIKYIIIKWAALNDCGSVSFSLLRSYYSFLTYLCPNVGVFRCIHCTIYNTSQNTHKKRQDTNECHITNQLRQKGLVSTDFHFNYELYLNGTIFKF